ncbi:methionyl-tRNA formyltransferase [uncultured Duncaniella sp.]|uniref:methionyl-tRNA formyltransferase n=1 Tax=uncultured Duncaniella sp. TaxID=2768039 RepID=UPI0025D65899|nr:methionyl-tRNA formyltransferase [uncultured Duncaniella sp.]
MTKENLRIVFLGTPDFAVESLRRIVEGGYNVVGVVTMPDKPAGRGHKLYQSPVKEYAVTHGLHLMQPVKLKDPEFVEELRSLNADLFVVIAFRMLPEIVWTMPRLGTFNLHASLLPRYRGAAPINWAVINGDTETGVTTFFLKHEIDTGDIIAQERVEILPTDNVGDVHDRLMLLGADLTIKTIDNIIAGTLTTVAQEELIGDTEPTPAPKIFKETCKIDWNAPAVTIHNLVRGLSPYPAAWTTLLDGDTELGAVKIFETRIHPANTNLSPGEIIIEGQTLLVGTGDGNPIEILSLQAPGKRRMPTPDFLRGSRLTAPRFE